MKIKVRTKKEIFNNLVALFAFACIAGGLFLFGWAVAAVLPTSIEEGVGYVLEWGFYAFLVYWLIFSPFFKIEKSKK